jgi:amidase
MSLANISNLTDNFEQLEGAPCSIQVFTTTLRDEECLQMTKQIDRCLKGTA